MAQIDKNYFDVDENIKQNKVEDILIPGEEVLARLNPHKQTFILESILKGLPIALVWAGFDFFFIFMMIQTGAFNDMGPGFVFGIIAFFAIHLIPVWLYIVNIVKKLAGYKNIEYVLTDKRVIIRSGLIGVDFKFIYYSDIDSINVKVGIFDRLFKVGDLHIKSNTQTAVIEDIKAPYAYSAKIQKIVTDLKTDMAYPNDLRPKTNHGYNTKYTGDENNK